MTNSTESKFRQYLNKTYPGAFIKKLPDFKQTGKSGAAGLPDYIVVWRGMTTWFEVKKVNSKKFFPFKTLSEVQWTVCRQLEDNSALVYVAAYMKGELNIIPFSVLHVAAHDAIMKTGKKSLKLTENYKTVSS